MGRDHGQRLGGLSAPLQPPQPPHHRLRHRNPMIRKPMVGVDLPRRHPRTRAPQRLGRGAVLRRQAVSPVEDEHRLSRQPWRQRRRLPALR
jgi:hypothetical protein